MKKFNFAFLSDCVLSTIIIFGLSMIMLSPIKRPLYLKILLSSLISFSLLSIFILFEEKRLNKKLIKKNDKKAIENLKDFLEICPDNEVIGQLMELLKAFDLPCKKVKKRLENENAVFFFNFDFSTSRKIISDFLKEGKDKKIVVFSSELDESAKELAKSQKDKLSVIYTSTLYFMLKEKNLTFKNMPEIKKAPSFFSRQKSNLKNLLTKKRARNFTLSGITFLLFSYFTFYPYFYRLCAFISFLVAVFCLIYGKPTKKDEFSLNDFINENNDKLRP